MAYSHLQQQTVRYVYIFPYHTSKGENNLIVRTLIKYCTTLSYFASSFAKNIILTHVINCDASRG